MKKKFYGALLLGSLFLAGGMVSCSDYDDDINSLTQRVDALEKTVAELQKAIEAGAVITNVQSTENGVTVTLSDGKTFEVKNGAKGEDGADGSVIEIRKVDGVDYWFLDGENTGYPVKGEKGDDGNDGNDGNDGQDGKDGCWYFPNEDGFWHKQYYNEEGEIVDEATTIGWTPSAQESVRVVYDSVNGRLLISNAEGMQEGEVLVIETWGELKSLAVIPYTIDKESGLPVVSFYNIVKDGDVLESTDATAHFRLNPNNANIEGWEWSIIDRKAVVRAEGDNVNDLLAINEYYRADGEMVVSLKSKKSIADLNKDEIAIFALNGTNTANGNNIASDYAKVTSKDLKDFAIINPTEAPEFVFDAANQYPTTIEDIDATTDADLVYTESIDLNTLVWTWAKDALAPNTTLENLNIDGLTYEFSKPEEYLGSDETTNQQEFVNLDGSIVTVNDYTTAAIGRTPIFLAKALVNGTVVATGYIKLDIVESAPAEDKEDEVLTVACGTINYQELDAISENTKVNALAWQVVNQFYSKYGLTAETFHTNYNEPTASDIKAETGVVLTNNWWDNGSATSSDAATIDIDPTTVKVVELLGKEREATITFTSKNKKVYPNVVVKFTYTIADKITFPTLNKDYLVAGEEDMVEVKGRVETVNGKQEWKMVSGIKEHFTEYLANYKLAANHTNMYAELPVRVPDEDPFLVQHGAEIVGGNNASVQDIQLTEALTTASRDYVVYFHIVLANGEQQTMEYKVRFSTPFEVSINEVKLKTLASPTTADLAKAIVIKGVANEVVYQNGALNTANAKAYAITEASYFGMEYGLSGSDTDSWESFGNRLTISNVDDPSTTTVNEKGQITWDNEGALLQNDKIATSEVTVTAGTIAVIKATGKVTVLSSENSKN